MTVSPVKDNNSSTLASSSVARALIAPRVEPGCRKDLAALVFVRSGRVAAGPGGQQRRPQRGRQWPAAGNDGQRTIMGLCMAKGKPALRCFARWKPWLLQRFDSAQCELCLLFFAMDDGKVFQVPPRHRRAICRLSDEGHRR